MQTNRLRFWGLIAILLAIGCSENLTKDDIKSVTAPLAEQQLMVWQFEREMECENFSPCFSAIVDGALQRDPAKACKNCEEAVKGLAALNVPFGLPDKVSRKLDEARRILMRNAQWSLDSARFTAGRTNQTAGFVPNDAETCYAYGRIDAVNTLYGLKPLMKGHYINCAVLDAEPPPVFPSMEQLH